MEKESNGELAFLDTFLTRNDGKISALVYRMPTHTDQYLHYISHHKISCKESDVSKQAARKLLLFNRAYSIITNDSFPQFQQPTQVTDIQEEEIIMSINLVTYLCYIHRF